jgi:hypothetical protein
MIGQAEADNAGCHGYIWLWACILVAGAEYQKEGQIA